MRALAIILLVAVASAAQGGGFEPLDRWKAAVLAGDQNTLRSLYADPQASEFWSRLAAQGLVDINPKILMHQSSGPDTVRLVLRIEMTFRPGSGMAGLVSARQMWVRQAGAWHVVEKRSAMYPLPVIRLPQPEVPNTNLYPDPGEAQAELSAAIEAAKADHKRVLVIFGANWCYDCHVLDATLRSREVAPLVAANYHVLHINVGDEDRNTDLAERFEVPLNKGIPGLAVLDGDGRVVTSLKNGEFESAAKIGMSDVTGFLERWKPGAKAQ